MSAKALWLRICFGRHIRPSAISVNILPKEYWHVTFASFRKPAHLQTQWYSNFFRRKVNNWCTKWSYFFSFEQQNWYHKFCIFHSLIDCNKDRKFITFIALCTFYIVPPCESLLFITWNYPLKKNCNGYLLLRIC